MKTLSLPEVAIGLTVADLERLPKVDGFDYEIDRGRLRIMAAAALRHWHTEMQVAIRSWFREQGQIAFLESGVLLDGATTRTPDVGVLWKPPESDAAYHPARDYAVVVEVTSPESEDEDRLVKPRLYAAAGIPQFWLVEPVPDDGWDASIGMYKVEPTGYALHRTVRWSEFAGG